MELAFEKLELGAGKFSLRADGILRGPVTGVFGPSGAGKSTLLEAIAGLREPRAGRMLLDGVALFGDGHRVPARERRVGYVPQDLALFPHLSVEANLRFGQPTTERREGGPSLASVCEVLELSPLLPRHPETLSGGEQRRVALGRALLAQPQLLLLDEPLANLDDALRARIVPYLLRVRERFSLPMIYVTHSVREVARLCDEVVTIEGGQTCGPISLEAFIARYGDGDGL